MEKQNGRMDDPQALALERIMGDMDDLESNRLFKAGTHSGAVDITVSVVPTGQPKEDIRKAMTVEDEEAERGDEETGL